MAKEIPPVPTPVPVPMLTVQPMPMTVPTPVPVPTTLPVVPEATSQRATSVPPPATYPVPTPRCIYPVPTPRQDPAPTPVPTTSPTPPPREQTPVPAGPKEEPAPFKYQNNSAVVNGELTEPARHAAEAKAGQLVDHAVKTRIIEAEADPQAMKAEAAIKIAEGLKKKGFLSDAVDGAAAQMGLPQLPDRGAKGKE